MKEKILLSWSGGKDSALALYYLQHDHRYEVVSLVTTLTEDFDRVSIHGIARNIIEAQSKSMGIPVEFVKISANATNEEYERQFCQTLSRWKQKGVSGVAYGDIFLVALKEHRESMLSQIGMKGIFPLWQKETKALARFFIEKRFGALLSCVDTDMLPAHFAGAFYDQNLLHSLPASVDPCGENGEFHSCVFRGPIFKNDLILSCEGQVQRKQFIFSDIRISSE